VPPWPQPQIVSATLLLDDRNGERLRCAHMEAKRGEQSVENPFAVLITS
jgi:hypothetical protein